jgi:hypothetical protein
MDQSNESGLFVPPLAAVSHDTTQIKESGLMMLQNTIRLHSGFGRFLANLPSVYPPKGGLQSSASTRHVF